MTIPGNRLGNANALFPLTAPGWKSSNHYQIPASSNNSVTLVTAATNFDTFLFAYPETFALPGRITELNTYILGTATSKGWVGVYTNTFDSNGNPYPFKRLGGFETVPGNDGLNVIRSGTVSIEVSDGQLVWFVVQQSADGGGAGIAAAFMTPNGRGQDLPSPASTATPKAYVGLYSDIAAAYNPTLAQFPSSGISELWRGQALPAFLIGGGVPTSVPICAYKFTSNFRP